MGTNYYHRVEGKKTAHWQTVSGMGISLSRIQKENEPDGFEIDHGKTGKTRF